MDERRKAKPPETRGVLADLNEAQLLTLHSLESFGWELKFVRKPMFQPPTVVVFDPARSHPAVIDAEGNLVEEVDLPVRELTEK